MSRRLLETAVRPVRIAFLLGRNPSNRLLNAVISANSGLWGGIHNFICPTNGSSIPDEYLQLLEYHSPDCIAVCGRFSNRRNVINQLKEHDIHPCFLHKNIGLDRIEKFGIGIEGIFDARFLQSIRRGTFIETAIVDPRLTRATFLDKVIFGIPPRRIKKYMEDRVEFITLTRYRSERQRSEPDFDELIGIVQITGENLNAYGTVEGRRLVMSPSRLRRLYFVIGSKNCLEDACYFWNLRAILGIDRVRWIALEDLSSFLSKREVTYSPMLTLTSASGAYRKEIEDALQEAKPAKGTLRYSHARAVLRMRANSLWQSELKRDHITTDDGEFVIPPSRPSSFELVYPQRFPRWVMDLRIVRDYEIGTEGLILPNVPYLFDIMTPTPSARLKPQIRGNVFSFQISSVRTDEHVKFRIPTDWEVIRAIFMHSGHRIGLSDQGNYMSRALALFGGLPGLSALLRDARTTAIFDEFVKHHRTGERTAGDKRYRRALTLDDMRRAVLNLTGSKSRKKKEADHRFIEELVRKLIRLGAIHSGYLLDCSQCRLEDWYPIDEVAENFRCRRCLSDEIRPLSPPIFFRLNEALYQAYAHNFAVPTLVLDVLHKSTNASFIFSPQIKLDETDDYSNEIDIVALRDGEVLLGEAKSNDKIKKEQIDLVESIALEIKANRIVFGTASRHSCRGVSCADCSKEAHYADNAFSHGSSGDPQFWGTRECIKDLRQRLFKQGIRVASICAEDIRLGAMLRNRSGRVFIPTR